MGQGRRWFDRRGVLDVRSPTRLVVKSRSTLWRSTNDGQIATTLEISRFRCSVDGGGFRVVCDPRGDLLARRDTTEGRRPSWLGPGDSLGTAYNSRLLRGVVILCDARGQKLAGSRPASPRVAALPSPWVFDGLESDHLRLPLDLRVLLLGSRAAPWRAPRSEAERRASPPPRGGAS